jgi:hypothetical protein
MAKREAKGGQLKEQHNESACTYIYIYCCTYVLASDKHYV